MSTSVLQGYTDAKRSNSTPSFDYLRELADSFADKTRFTYRIARVDGNKKNHQSGGKLAHGFSWIDGGECTFNISIPNEYQMMNH